MLRVVFLIFIGLKTLTYPLAVQSAEIPSNNRPAAVEHSLVAFSSPQAMLHPGPLAEVDRLTISERMTHYNVPGVSIAVIDRNRMVWTKSYGETKIGSGQPVNEETLFQAASTTKLVTSIIVLKLVEDGLLDLDKDVNTYLQSWQIPENEFTESKHVTLRLLLTHQAGFNRPDGGFDSDGAPTLIQTLNGKYPAKSAPAIVEFTPGSSWRYSNFGYLIIQQIVEDVSQQSFAEIAQELIFDPLGMNRSTFDVPISAELQQNEALPHDGDGIPREPALTAAAIANGGLRTTPTDLAKFTVELLKAYADQSDHMLTRETAISLFEKQVDVPPDVFGLPLEEGLGVLLSGKGAGKTFLHPGENEPGATCWLSGVAGSGQGVIVMTNGARGSLLAMEVLVAVADEYTWPSLMLP